MGKNELVMFLEFVFWFKGFDNLCYFKGFQWNRNVKIVLIIIFKNQGWWMVYFLNNLEEIYSVLKDNKVSLAIYDYKSFDMNLEQELVKRKFFFIKVIVYEVKYYFCIKFFNRAVE